MTLYYVATLARYVLVDATNEASARQIGQAALQAEAGDSASILVRTVRPATDDEIDLWHWHQDQLARERIVTDPKHASS
jgi:hypothetical protein